MYASSTITDRSHAICSSLPPPTAIPLIRAIGRLAELTKPVVHVLERPEPLPVLARLVEERLVPARQVGADAERATRAGDDDGADLVVPGGVLGGPRDLAEHPEVERVENLGTVQPDGRARRRLLVDDPLEAELGRVDGDADGLGSLTTGAYSVTG